jgi:Domain of unknown function (DUF4259)
MRPTKDTIGEYDMGAWGTGAFDNDDAADFAGELDALDPGQRPEVIADVLSMVAAEEEFLEADLASVAVAAASLVAAQRPGGTAPDSVYGPKEAVPPLPADLPPVAVRALDRVLGEESELRQVWAESADAAAWQEGVTGLRTALAG